MTYTTRVSFVFLLLFAFPVYAASMTLPNDPGYERQLYHRETKVIEAWQEGSENGDLKIAVLDTGVDFNHPDLKDNLIPGFNLVKPGTSPMDDHGHGTSTTGILAASGNNGQGVAGVLWKAKVMPIKTLDEKGGGDAKRVAQGIRLAIEQGAKIILLSLGDPIYSAALEEAVKLAEKQGVLIVAATGNNTSTVSYPAAFPTVLSVGAVDTKGNPLSYMNRGPELDVLAPGHSIWTTAKGGSYHEVSGTSMAAPQVAGIAALLWKKNPSLSPFDLRTILRTSSSNQGKWHPDTGYGLVNAEAALVLASQSLHGLPAPKSTIEQATPLPIVTQTRGWLGSKAPNDWYRLDIPYEGTLTIQATSNQEKEGVIVEIYNEQKKRVRSQTNMLQIELPKGSSYLHLQYSGKAPLFLYDLHLSFAIAPEDYENNDTKERAVQLPVLAHHQVTGNFHQSKDVDWFKATYPRAGELELRVQTDTLGMDPVLMVEAEGQWREEVDSGNAANRQEEYWHKKIQPGTFFFQLRDYYGNVTRGEYQFSLRYKPESILGLKDLDHHWSREAVEGLVVKGVVQGYPDGSFRPNDTITRATAAVILQRALGVADVRQSTLAISDLPGNHWAYLALQSLVEKGIITTSADGRLFPDRPLTRAELAVILYRAQQGTQAPKVSEQSSRFSDLSADHKAYSYIMKMSEKGILQGFQDGSFQPERKTTRAEFAVLIYKMGI